jgi:hypothetical protein
VVDDSYTPDQVSIEVVYVDEHLIELEAVVNAGHWRGRARAYTVFKDIAGFAIALQKFAEGTIAEAEFVGGKDNGIGFIAMRFYRIDRAGHIALHIRLATGHMPPRSEQVSRLALEVSAEARGVGQFAQQLRNLGGANSGRACLAIETDA